MDLIPVRQIPSCTALVLAMVAIVAIRDVSAQRPSPAEGPWSGQAQCVVVGKWTDYLDEQTHTWQLTGEAGTPAPRGSAQVFYTWPAVWGVQGSGRKTWPSPEPGGREQSERWTIAHQMTATLRVTEIAGQTVRLRIGAEGQRGAPLGSIRVTEVSGRTRDASVQPWPFPTIEDDATKTTISGTSTRTYPEGFGVGWGQPAKAITTATCSWNFTRESVERISATDATGSTTGQGDGRLTTVPETTNASVATVASGTAIRPPAAISSESVPLPYAPRPLFVTFDLNANGTWYVPAPLAVNFTLNAQGLWYRPAPVAVTFDLNAAGTWVEVRGGMREPLQPITTER